MAVVTPVAPSVADPGPPLAPALPRNPITSDAARRRLRLFDGLAEVGCELIALSGESARALAASRGPDRECDDEVAAMRQQARCGAEESAVFGCGCWTRFRAIDAHGARYVVADAAEDGLVSRALRPLRRLIEIVRGMNRALTRELKRRQRRAGVRP